MATTIGVGPLEPIYRLIVGGLISFSSAGMIGWHWSSWRRFLTHDRDAMQGIESQLKAISTGETDQSADRHDDDSGASTSDRSVESSPAQQLDGDHDHQDDHAKDISGEHRGNGNGNLLSEIASSIESQPSEERLPGNSKGDDQESKSTMYYGVNEATVVDHYKRQFKQRTVTSALIGLIGLLLMTSYPITNLNVLMWGLYLVLLLVLIVFCSAMLDAARTQRFFRENDQGFRKARNELLEEYQRLKAKQKSIERKSRNLRRPDSRN